MATYPPKLELPYRVSRAWLEEHTLAGEVVEPVHRFVIEADQMSSEMRQRVAALAKRVRPTEWWGPPTETVEVIGSGIDPTDHATTDSGRELYATDPIVQRLGEFPELPEPTSEPTALIEAYEAWISRYLDLSMGALAAWIDRWAVEGEPDEDGKGPNGLPINWWVRWVPYRVGTERGALEVDGRTHLELFHKVAACSQQQSHAQMAAGSEDMKIVLDIVGDPLQLETKPVDVEDLVEAYSEHMERIINLAFARHWVRQRQREGFDLEMSRWAFERGSERLKIGISDGYRMIPVYLHERISAEVPGFYAHLPKKDDKHTWQPRTGPSEEALRLRRAVQERLERYAPPGGPVPTAEVGWMKNPPLAMCDERHAYGYDEWGNREDEIQQCAFEIIGVKNWLGRYTLIAGVYTQAEDQPPDFLLLKYVLNPTDYELEDLPMPPGGDSIAQNHQNFTPASAGDDDIPF
ncbi:MAG TPA: hypothetical protein VG053_07780 [Solirubrobacteraceae bacterium]|nr:hypothetical protein [Solirubrobacteraceae bacterium]